MLATKNMVAPASKLGVGLYTPADAATFARVQTRLLNRWLFGTQDSDSVVDPEIGNSDDKIVSFLDFMQVLSIRAIRDHEKIPLTKIREAVHVAEEEYGVEYPFARRHKIFLRSDFAKSGHGEIVIKVPSTESGKEKYVEVSGRHRHNQVMHEIAESFMSDVSYNSEGVAERFVPFTWRDKRIVMDPKLRFGEPIIEGAGYSPRTLWEAIRIEGSVSNAAREYGVEEDDVLFAERYRDHLSIAPVN